jgi:hypothetical protein
MADLKHKWHLEMAAMAYPDKAGPVGRPRPVALAGAASAGEGAEEEDAGEALKADSKA